MMNFEFATATRIIFQPGAIEKIGSIAALFGQKALVVAGFSSPDLNRLGNILTLSGLEYFIFKVNGEPTIHTIEEGCIACREQGCDLVIGFGGGSALDSAKAIAAMLTNPGNLLDYLEVVGRNQSIMEMPAPFIAIPTTAGTGSEVTRNAVISVPEKKVKVSMRSPLMLARVALIDPQLMINLPPEITSSTGMDALSQVIEPFVSKRANAFTDIFCREGIKRGSRSLLRAFESGSDLSAREDMAFTSLMGGLSLANAGLGAVHGFAGPIGGMFNAPHGAVCACLLPPVVNINARALADREPNHPALLRYDEIARMILNHEKASVTDLVHWLDELRRALSIPMLRNYGLRSADVPALIEMSAVASSMKANPIELLKSELVEILESAL